MVSDKAVGEFTEVDEYFFAIWLRLLRWPYSMSGLARKWNKKLKNWELRVKERTAELTLRQ